MTSSSSSTSFYIVLPSNTNVEENRTNSFRVHLPRKLQFGSQWCVGLAVLVYPHSWPSLGTTEAQSVRVHWHTGQHLDIPVPAAHVKSPHELADRLRTALEAGSDELASQLVLIKQKRAQATANAEKRAREHHKQLTEQHKFTSSSSPIVRTNETTTTTVEKSEELSVEERKNIQEVSARSYERLLSKYMALELQGMLGEEELHLLEATSRLGIDAWVHAYERPEVLCRFHFDAGLQRFRLKMDTKFVQAVHLSTQLAYILGFADAQLQEAHTTARYMPDMTGGVASFYVYAPGLIEPVIIGDVAAPVLRIVNLRGQTDDIVEECYVAIQYHRLIMKEISDIQIEIRTPSGALMPFQYGTCTLTLHFKKIPYF